MTIDPLCPTCIAQEPTLEREMLRALGCEMAHEHCAECGAPNALAHPCPCGAESGSAILALLLILTVIGLAIAFGVAGVSIIEHAPDAGAQYVTSL